MSIATMERAIMQGLRAATGNKKLRLKDMMEWSTGKIKVREGETLTWVPDPGVWVAWKVKQ